MLDVAIIGAIWGLGIWLVYFGYFTTQAPKKLKRWIYAKKYRIFILDLVVVFLGNMVINKASGTIVSGIGTFVLALTSFTASLIMIFFSWSKRKVSELIGGHYV